MNHFIRTAIEEADALAFQCEFCDDGPDDVLCTECQRAFDDGDLLRCNLGCGGLYYPKDDIHCECWERSDDRPPTPDEAKDFEQERFRPGAE